LCPDRSVAACLLANGVPQVNGVALAMAAHEVPADVPVVILHDAGAAGLRFAAQARRALGDRLVVDAGLRPQTVMEAGDFVRLRGDGLPDDGVDELRALGVLTAGEINWLAKGWWAPAAAIAPRPLIAAVADMVESIDGAEPGPPQERKIGFMSRRRQERSARSAGDRGDEARRNGSRRTI
jgi:hypothetical protein